MKNLKSKKRIARMSGVAGIVLGIGMLWLFKNNNGLLPLVLGFILALWGFRK